MKAAKHFSFLVTIQLQPPLKLPFPSSRQTQVNVFLLHSYDKFLFLSLKIEKKFLS